MSEPTLRRYTCGSTRFRLSRIFKTASNDVRIFPSAVYLYRHPSGARVLFDTGYAPSMDGTGLAGALYQRVLPPDVPQEATIDRRLAADGLTPGDIAHVVISHAHPDHIGGARYFPGSTFIISRGQIDALRKSSLFEVVFPELLPEGFSESSLRILDESDLGAEAPRGLTGFDLFGDGGFVVVPLPGHARGHLGALVEGNVLLGADATWGREFLESFDDMRALPRAISHDLAGAKATAQLLLALERDGVRLVFSHDDESEDVLIP